MKGSAVFPPIDWLWDGYRVNGAWYSGAPMQLKRHTKGFWRGAERGKVHVPVAADIAAISAALTFSGSPSIVHEDARANARLQQIWEHTSLYAKLITAAELCSAYGGVFLKLSWDTENADAPMISVVPGYAGVAEWAFDRLVGARFYSEVDGEGQNGVFRLEQHYLSDGSVQSRLWRGGADTIGEAVALSTLKATAGVPAVAHSGAGRLLAVYVPNRGPNRLKPGLNYGASDYDGLHGLFSALDEVASSLMRDVRLGKTRVIVPMEYLRRKDLLFKKLDGGTDFRWEFDSSDEIYTALDINPQDGVGITTVQPGIRAAEHGRAMDDLIRKIYALAGISPQTAGIDINGQGESGVALNVRERRSLQFAEMKKSYWWHGLKELSGAAIALDAAVYGGGMRDGKVSVSFADSSQPDMATVAATLEKLSRAGAISTKGKVELLRPDLSEDEVRGEVRGIEGGG